MPKSTKNTPLAPSVEKAYYRKCIELKRRLNEVEAANDEAKIRRVRLDRAIMKMRLERAFLLEQLSKRMKYNVDGSEGSGDENMATPPPERPHRDKRRRQQPAGQSSVPPTSQAHLAGPSYTSPHAPPGMHTPGEPWPLVAYGPNGEPVRANTYLPDGRPAYIPPENTRPQNHESPYGAPVGLPGAASRRENGMAMDGADERDRDLEVEHPTNRRAGATGEPLRTGPAIREDANGERRIVSSGGATAGDTESDGAGFTAVNN